MWSRKKKEERFSYYLAVRRLVTAYQAVSNGSNKYGSPEQSCKKKKNSRIFGVPAQLADELPGAIYFKVGHCGFNYMYFPTGVGTGYIYIFYVAKGFFGYP